MFCSGIKIDEEANPYYFGLFYRYYVCLFGLCGIVYAIFPVVKWIAAANYKSFLCALFYPASEANFSSKSSLFIFNGNAIDSSVRFAFFYIQRKERNRKPRNSLSCIYFSNCVNRGNDYLYCLQCVFFKIHPMVDFRVGFQKCLAFCMDDTSSIHDFLHFCNADRPFYCFNQSVAKDFSVSGTCFAEFVFYVYVFILSNCKRMQNKYCINQ